MFNIAVVFLLSGLWHGASWCFIIWGAYWAAVYVCAKLRGSGNDRIGVIGTMALVVIGWGIFRCQSVEEVWNYVLGGIAPVTVAVAVGCALLWAVVRKFTPPHLLRGAGWRFCVCLGIVLLVVSKLASGFFLLLFACVMVAEWSTRNDADGRMYPLPRRRGWRYALYVALYLAIITAPDVDAQFIYFQF